MKKQTVFRTSWGTTLGSGGLTTTAGLAALVLLLGAGVMPATGEDSLGGGVSTEQNTTEQNSNDSVSAETDAKMSGDGGDCQVSAHASASSTSNGETVSRQSEKKVEGPCGKASAKASASSSSKSGGESNSGGQSINDN